MPKFALQKIEARQNVEQGEFRRLKNLYLASLALETTKNKTS